jgi:hypothetical protein
LLCSISVPRKILWFIVFCNSEYSLLNCCTWNVCLFLMYHDGTEGE